MRTQRTIRHRDRGRTKINELRFFRTFSGIDKLSHGMQPTIAECNALERIGIICNHHKRPISDNVNINTQGQEPSYYIE